LRCAYVAGRIGRPAGRERRGVVIQAFETWRDEPERSRRRFREALTDPHGVLALRFNIEPRPGLIAMFAVETEGGLDRVEHELAAAKGDRSLLGQTQQDRPV